MSDDLHQTASGKRRDVISWDEFFMSVAIAAQRRSKDPNTQVGACIASTNHRILSVGYNGTPSGFENVCEDETGKTKPYVLHAEANAITKVAKSANNCDGSTLYITAAPCIECSKLIIQAGIKRVVYCEEYRSEEGLDLLRKVGIECVQREIDER